LRPFVGRIQQDGICVWLKADLALLMKRVMKRNDRPLLRTADPEAVMRRLIEERYPVYAQSDITVECRDVQHTQMVNDVLRALAQKAEETRPVPHLQTEP
jgi:shikimate kinase